MSPGRSSTFTLCRDSVHDSKRESEGESPRSASLAYPVTLLYSVNIFFTYPGHVSLYPTPRLTNPFFLNAPKTPAQKAQETFVGGEQPVHSLLVAKAIRAKEKGMQKRSKKRRARRVCFCINHHKSHAR